MSLGRFPKLSLKSGKWDKKGREKSASKITSGDPFIFEIQVQGNSFQLLRHGKEKKNLQWKYSLKAGLYPKFHEITEFAVCGLV